MNRRQSCQRISRYLENIRYGIHAVWKRQTQLTKKQKQKKLKACQIKHVKVENDANARASEFHFQEF